MYHYELIISPAALNFERDKVCRSVTEYSLTLINPEELDTQELTAAFTHIPSPTDWQQWLSGWFDCG